MRALARRVSASLRAGDDRRRTLVSRAVVVLLVTGVAAAGWYAWDRSRQLPEDAVLRYGEKVVTERELRARVDVLGALYGVVRPEEAEKAADFDRLAAKSYAVSLVIDQAAADRGIEIGGKEARDRLDALIEDQMSGGRPAFVQFLEDSRISEGDVLEEVSRQLLTARLIEEVTKDVEEVGEDEVRAAFRDNRDDFVVPETRKIGNIVVADRGEAVKVRRLAGQGRNFAALARTFSRDESTRDKGGLLGTLARSQLEADFAQAAFAATPGEVFGPVQTRFGWNVGQVVAVGAARPLAYADVKAELRTQLQNERRLETWRGFLGDLLASADVEYAGAYEPPDPEAPPAEDPDVDLGGESPDGKTPSEESDAQ